MPAPPARETQYDDEENPIAVIPVSHPSSAAAAASAMPASSAPQRQVPPQPLSARPAALHPISQVNQALGSQVLPGPDQPQVISSRPATLAVPSSQNSPTAAATLSMVQEAAVAAQALLFPNSVASQSAQNLYQLTQPQQTTSIKRKAPEEEAPAPPKPKRQR